VTSTLKPIHFDYGNENAGREDKVKMIFTGKHLFSKNYPLFSTKAAEENLNSQ